MRRRIELGNFIFSWILVCSGENGMPLDRKHYIQEFHFSRKRHASLFFHTLDPDALGYSILQNRYIVQWLLASACKAIKQAFNKTHVLAIN